MSYIEKSPTKRKRNKQDSPERKKKNPVSWQMSWLHDPLLKDWLQKHPNKAQTAVCRYCLVDIRYGRKSDLMNHYRTQKHTDEINIAKKANKFENLEIENPCIEDTISTAERRVTIFMLENNISLKAADDFVSLIKELNNIENSEDMSNIVLKEANSLKIVKKILYENKTDCQMNNVVKTLNSTYFSILFNENFIVSNKKTLCVFVQYFDTASGNIVKHLLQLIEVKTKQGIAIDIFNEFKSFCDRKNINLQNIVGLVYDAPIMFGEAGNFQKYLRNVVPHLIVLKSAHHSLEIITEQSCSKIPKSVEDLYQSVSVYFSNNPNHISKLEKFLKKLDLSTDEISKLSEISWQDVYRCYSQFVIQWPALLCYFDAQVSEIKSSKSDNSKVSNDTNSAEDNLSCVEVHDLLSNNSIRAYMTFLVYVSIPFNTFNTLLQSQELTIHKLYKSILLLIKEISMNFIEPEALEQVTTKDFEISKNCMPLSNIYLGPECQKMFEVMPEATVTEIRSNCLHFYEILLKEMRDKLLENQDLLRTLIFLDPHVASSVQARKEFPDLSNLCEYFPFINITSLAYEWRSLPFALETEEYINLSVESFWKSVLEYKVGDMLRFPTLKTLILAVFSLSHSFNE